MVDRVEGITTQVFVMAIVISIILLFLGISVLVLIHICIVGRTLRSSLNETITNNNVIERGSLGSTSMSRDDIEKLPSFDFMAKETAQKGTSPPPNCAVCLEIFSTGEKCRLLPTCNHSFHAECVDLWLLRASLCPICRADADTTRSGSLSCGGESNRFMSEIGIELRDEPGHGVTENGDGNNEVEVQQGLGDDDGSAQDQGLNHVVDLGFSKSQEIDSASLNEVAIDIDQEMESASVKEVVTIVESVSLNEVTIDTEDDQGMESASLKEVTILDSQS